jgi:hypothetical protein
MQRFITAVFIHKQNPVLRLFTSARTNNSWTVLRDELKALSHGEATTQRLEAEAVEVTVRRVLENVRSLSFSSDKKTIQDTLDTLAGWQLRMKDVPLELRDAPFCFAYESGIAESRLCRRLDDHIVHAQKLMIGRLRELESRELLKDRELKQERWKQETSQMLAKLLQIKA